MLKPAAVPLATAGISEPMPVAATFHTPGSSGDSLSSYAAIDSMVSSIPSLYQSLFWEDIAGCILPASELRAVCNLAMPRYCRPGTHCTPRSVP